MTKRIDKVNSLIQQTFGEVLQSEADVPKDVLVTVSNVEVHPSLQSAKVWLYILPSPEADTSAEAVLDQLREQLYELQGSLNKKLNMRPLPRIVLQLDHGSEHAEKIEKRLAELEGGVSDDTNGA